MASITAVRDTEAVFPVQLIDQLYSRCSLANVDSQKHNTVLWRKYAAVDLRYSAKYFHVSASVIVYVKWLIRGNYCIHLTREDTMLCSGRSS